MTGHFEWVSAGHLEPLVLREGRAVKILEVPPMLPFGLGRSFGAPGTAATVGFEQLQPGDLLLLYTDGVTEARSPEGDFFGLDRLVDLVVRNLAAGLPAPEMRRAIRACSSTSRETSATTPPSSSSSGTATPRACSGPEGRPLSCSPLDLKCT